MNVRIISYDTAKAFIKVPYLTLKERYVYFGLFKQEQLISVLGVESCGNGKYKMHANFTPASFRGQGCFTLLLDAVIKALTFDAKEFIADCTDDSVGVYKRLGFAQVRKTEKMRKYNITRMRYAINGKTEKRD